MFTSSSAAAATPLAVARILLFICCGLPIVVDCQNYIRFRHKFWTDEDCPPATHLGTYIKATADACTEKCSNTAHCTRINYATVDPKTCALFNCDARFPSGNRTLDDSFLLEGTTDPLAPAITEHLKKFACNALNGNCQDKNNFCGGELKLGNKWCKRSKKYGCCIPPKGNDCELQAVRGHGPFSLLRFYYHVDSRQCLKFFWGGIGGNANRFITWEECTRKCGYRPYESSAAHIEPNNTYLVKVHNRCNDNYDKWILQTDAKSHSLAEKVCTSKSMDLACPWNEATFIEWLRTQDNKEFWLAGTQGLGSKFNYYFWADNHEVKRYIHENGRNLWSDTNPTYPNTTQGCIKGNDLLTIDDCKKTHIFFCSK